MRIGGRGRWAALVSVAVLAVGAVPTGGVLAQDPSIAVDEAMIADTEAIIDQMLDPSWDSSLQAYWAETFPTFSDVPYADPAGGFFPYRTGEGADGACGGTAEDSAQNASYCPTDQSIVWDVQWLAELSAQHGRAAAITVMAHEWGHHIQEVAGAPAIDKQAELQADCYSGMYLGFLAGQGELEADDLRAMLDVVYSIGDDPSNATDWTDADVHGNPEERRQAAGIGLDTGDGSYCVAYGDWQDEPAVELFGGNLIRLEPFGDPLPLEDGSYGIELPGAQVQVVEVAYDPGTAAADQVVTALEESVPEAAGWELGEVDPSWIEGYRWATGTGATVEFRGAFDDGSTAGGVAALLIDTDGSGQLFLAIGADTEDPEAGVAQAWEALDALAWGYCDPDAEVTDNCPQR